MKPKLVVVIDSGWDERHAHVRVLPSVSVTLESDRQIRFAEGGADQTGHGTMCARIILGESWNATIQPIKIFGEDNRSSGLQLLAALELAEHYAPSVVSLSLSYQDDWMTEPFCERVRRLSHMGCSVVAARFGTIERVAPAVRGRLWLAEVGDDSARSAGVVSVPSARIKYWFNANKFSAVATNSFATAVVAGVLARDGVSAESIEPAALTMLLQPAAGKSR